MKKYKNLLFGILAALLIVVIRISLSQADMPPEPIQDFNKLPVEIRDSL